MLRVAYKEMKRQEINRIFQFFFYVFLYLLIYSKLCVRGAALGRIV